jgi:isoleucyl-tRNA synthetase
MDLALTYMKLFNKFDAKMIENEVRSYLDDIDYVRLLREKYSGAKNTVGFIEGPPTLNAEPHMGHLRGRIIKDLWYRFKTMQGNNVVFRAGWDTQGLPIELQAEKTLGLTGNKSENISQVGIDTIVATCKDLIRKNAKRWIEVDRLLGMSFDYDNAYWTYKDEYIEREWKYLKNAWEKGILDEWFRVVAYCPSCQTSLSNSEVNQGYKNIEDPSFYYKVKLSGENSYLLVWTTMPFTLVTDELVGVNPDADYLFVNVNNEVWIVASDRLNPLMEELGISNYVVTKTVLGKELEGKYYIHPLLDLIPGLKKLSNAKLIHYIIADKMVDITTGSGLVHLAPANGEEDFDIASRRGLPIFVPIDDKVVFTEEAGVFAGKFVRDTDEMVVDAMLGFNALVSYGKILHQYPTCWRSGHQVVWLARREYFYMVDKLENKPLLAASKVEYFFGSPRNRFLEIIKEKVPWCISRERVWGTPIPIWKCKSCGKKDPLFSKLDIVSRASKLPDGQDFELHRPWIDRIEITCTNCGSIMSREPFVLDTWHNSGASPYASLSDNEFLKLIPADFLTEGIDQTRGWAYTLLINNIIMRDKAESPFKAFLFQGHLLDEKGNKMSKSQGNVIDAKEYLSKNSVDLLRYYLMWKASPIDSFSFNPEELSTRPYQVFSTLYNLHIYLQQNCEYDKFDLNKVDLENIKKSKFYGLMEKWINSKLQLLIRNVTKSIETCKFNDGAKLIEDFIINTLSQTYVPFTRDDLWEDSSESLERRSVIYTVLGVALRYVDILLYPFSPFITNYLFLVLFNTNKTIQLESWPPLIESDIDLKVEGLVAKMREIISLSNSARMKAKIKRRWPIGQVVIFSDNEEISQVEEYSDLMKVQLNTDKLEVKSIPQIKNIYDRVMALLDLCLIKISIKLKIKRFAPYLKDRLPILVSSFENVDRMTVLQSLLLNRSYQLKIGDDSFEIVKDDLDLTYSASDGYSIAETESHDTVIVIETIRDMDLVTKGFVKDLARNLQQLRKEMGYLPTDLLSYAHVSNLSETEVASLGVFKDELAYLVRAKSVEFYLHLSEKVKYKEIEIDGRKFLISIK